jgi:hypothetical protein
VYPLNTVLVGAYPLNTVLVGEYPLNTVLVGVYPLYTVNTPYSLNTYVCIQNRKVQNSLRSKNKFWFRVKGLFK